jgi:hypothetical protein
MTHTILFPSGPTATGARLEIPAGTCLVPRIVVDEMIVAAQRALYSASCGDLDATYAEMCEAIQAAVNHGARWVDCQTAAVHQKTSEPNEP